MARSAARTVSDELVALRDGGGEAVLRFTRDHAPSVLGWCIRLSGPDVDPARLAESILDGVLADLHRLPADLSIRATLLRRVLAAVRKRESRPWWRRARAEPEGGSEARRRVRATLARLALDERAALVLIDIEGMRVAGASMLLGVPVGELARRLSSARKAFSDAARAEGLSHDVLAEVGR